jgi:hypothetical protein
MQHVLGSKLWTGMYDPCLTQGQDQFLARYPWKVLCLLATRGGKGGEDWACMPSLYATGHTSIMKCPFGSLERLFQVGSWYVARMKHKRQAQHGIDVETDSRHIQDSKFRVYMFNPSQTWVWIPLIASCPWNVVCQSEKPLLPGMHRTALGSDSLWMPV